MALSSAALDRLHAAMAARVERKELPGIVTLVARDDEVHVDVLGTRAFGAPEPMQRDTPFRITSQTKPVIAAATMMFVDDGRLRLDDPVDRWLPELADRRVLKRIDGPLDETVPANRAVTIEDLLTMRFGYGMLVEPTFNPAFPIVTAGNDLQLTLNEPDPRTPLGPDEWIRRFGTLPLMYQPGEHWNYNVGTLVLGVLLARVGGQSLPDLLRSRIFEPLGMHTTGFSLPLEVTRGLPASYVSDFATGKLERRDVSTPEEWSRPPAFPSGSAGLVSTVDDFLQFARMLLGKGVSADGTRLLSAESVAAMTRNYLTPTQIAGGGPFLGGHGWGFGMGVVIEPDADWPIAGRYGWSGGYGTSWFNDPHQGKVALVMTQVSDFLWNGGLAEFEKLVAAA